MRFNKNHNDKPSWRKLQSRLGTDMPRGHAVCDLLFMDDSKEKSVSGLSGSPILPNEASTYIIGLTVQQKTEKGEAYELGGISVASQLEFLSANGIEIKKVDDIFPVPHMEINDNNREYIQFGDKNVGDKHVH